jgi:hypothetical protein
VPAKYEAAVLPLNRNVLPNHINWEEKGLYKKKRKPIQLTSFKTLAEPTQDTQKDRN